MSCISQLTTTFRDSTKLHSTPEPVRHLYGMYLHRAYAPIIPAAIIPDRVAKGTDLSHGTLSGQFTSFLIAMVLSPFLP